MPAPDLPDPLPIAPASAPLRATCRVPGSKSITCRALVLAALADGPSTLRGPLHSDDTDRLAAALAALGATIESDGDDLRVAGGAGRLPGAGRVDLGDGGTPARFMLAAATRAAGPVVVDGSPRLRERPMADGVDLLRRLGADVRPAPGDHLPVEIRPAPMHAGAIDVGVTASSQFVSALLLLAPFLDETLTLTFTAPPTSASYVDLTIDVLQRWGVPVHDERDDDGALRRVRVASVPVAGRGFAVEPDASSAVYPLTAAALVPGSTVTVEGLDRGSAQADAAFGAVLDAMGAEVADHPGRGAITVRGPAALRPIDADLSNMPDAAMAAAVAAACARGTSRLTGLRTLRVKETDRIAALATELGRLGGTVRATDDGLTITGPLPDARAATIETYRDHRMAMAFAVLGLARPGVSIADPGCVAKSWPGFWSALEGLRS